MCLCSPAVDREDQGLLEVEERLRLLHDERANRFNRAGREKRKRVEIEVIRDPKQGVQPGR
jgi:hypothetical protein